MNERSLFFPGSRSPYRPPSLTVSGLMILAGLIVASTQVPALIDYLDLRYRTVTAHGVVSSVSTRQNTESTRPHAESVVTHAFKVPDGRIHTGTVVRPSARMVHLQRGAPVEVFYRPDNPDRNTTGDDLFIRLWWQLLPMAAAATYWFGLSGIFIAQRIRRARRAVATTGQGAG